jgi:hypothetical protein
MFCSCICYISCINERSTVYSSSLLLRSESPGQDSLGRHTNQCATPHPLYIFIYSQDRSVYLTDQNRWTGSWKNINRSQMYEYGEYEKWERGRTV